MDPIDLFSLRERFNQTRIMLCFNGPMSRSLIEEIGNALKNYLTADQAHPSAAMDVFGVYIELTQNIRHYTHARAWSEQDAGATVVISREADGRYVICAGNLIEPQDGAAVCTLVDQLAGLDKAALKALYKEQLRKPRPDSDSGAGLGLIHVARTASAPLQASLHTLPDGRAFFSLRAVI